MRAAIKLTLYVILMLAAFTAFLSGLMMALSGNFSPLWLYLTIAAGGVVLAAFSLIKILQVNKAWKQQQTETHGNFWAEWTLSGPELDSWRNTYLNPVMLRRDARTYTLIAAAFIAPFVVLIWATASDILTAFTAGIPTSLLISYALYRLILYVNMNRKMPLFNTPAITVKANRNVILLNDTPIFLKTPGLTLDTIRLDKQAGVCSAVIVLGMYMGARRITQEHRIPYSPGTPTTAEAYFNRLAQVCGIMVQ